MSRVRVLKDIVCPVCKITFRPQDSSRKYCSRECAMKNIPKKGTFKKCKTCNKEIYLMKCQIKDNNYCSIKCQHTGLNLFYTRTCLNCGTEYKTTPSQVKHRGSNYCSIRCSRIGRGERNKGENCHFWKGGISSENRKQRSSKEWRVWREDVFKRDNYTCQDCGAKSGNGKTVPLHPHHIKQFAFYPELRFDVGNGITLCEPCHKKIKHDYK